jgi:hypothetical protein
MTKRIHRTNLGLAILHTTREPGRRYSCVEIAQWCGCSRKNVQQIETRALARLSRLLRKAGVDRATLDALVPDCSSCATRTQPAETV